jgi:hypothetical protein
MVMFSNDNLSPFEQRQIKRNSEKVVSLSGGLKLYVSKKIAKSIEEMILDLQDRKEVLKGEKSISSIMLSYIMKGYAEEKAELEKKQIEEEDKRTPIEKLRANYMDVTIPNRVKKVELPPVDGYIDYIDNGGIPVSALIERGKFSEKDIARLAVSVQALHLELRRTKSVADKVNNILKFKKDIDNKIKRTRIEKLCSVIFKKDDWNTGDYRNLFAFYHQFKNKLAPQDIEENVPDEAMPYVVNVHGFGQIGSARQSLAKSLMANCVN